MDATATSAVYSAFLRTRASMLQTIVEGSVLRFYTAGITSLTTRSFQGRQGASDAGRAGVRSSASSTVPSWSPQARVRVEPLRHVKNRDAASSNWPVRTSRRPTATSAGSPPSTPNSPCRQPTPGLPSRLILGPELTDILSYPVKVRSRTTTPRSRARSFPEQSHRLLSSAGRGVHEWATVRSTCLHTAPDASDLRSGGPPLSNRAYGPPKSAPTKPAGMESRSRLPTSPQAQQQQRTFHVLPNPGLGVSTTSTAHTSPPCWSGTSSPARSVFPKM